MVSDLIRGRPIWFGGEDRSEQSMALFYDWLGAKKTKGIRLAVMDMWKPFRNVTNERAPQAAILFDKFHIMRHLGKALDEVRKSEYRRLSGRDRSYIKGQKYTLLSRRENLSLDGRRALKKLLAANARLNRAYLLKESFGQLWDYESEGWARRFFDNWRASLKWQRLAPYEKFAEMIERHQASRAIYAHRLMLGNFYFELAREPEVAAARALREVRRNDRPSLGWDRRLLQAGEQGLARIRGGAQQQNPRHPAPRLRPARRGIPAAESSHLHAPEALKPLKITHSIP